MGADVDVGIDVEAVLVGIVGVVSVSDVVVPAGRLLLVDVMRLLGVTGSDVSASSAVLAIVELRIVVDMDAEKVRNDAVGVVLVSAAEVLLKTTARGGERCGGCGGQRCFGFVGFNCYRWAGDRRTETLD